MSQVLEELKGYERSAPPAPRSSGATRAPSRAGKHLINADWVNEVIGDGSLLLTLSVVLFVLQKFLAKSGVEWGYDALGWGFLAGAVYADNRNNYRLIRIFCYLLGGQLLVVPVLQVVVAWLAKL